jgi:hypothetical protein
MRRWQVLLVLILSGGVLARPALAQLRELSEYEAETAARAFEHTGYELDREPVGKVIESIEVVPFEVFEDRDFLPTTFPSESFNVAGVANWFHAVSRPHVIRREVLLRPGQLFDWSLVHESERNLRVRQLSVVLVLPARGTSPDRVRLLVVTKDVWSLRVNVEPRFVNGNIDYLAIQPSEENLFGLHKTVNALVQLSRATYSMGLGFVDPRVSGSRLQAAGSANVIFNCQSGDVEGSFGSFAYGKPLYSTRTQWSWVAAASWDSRIMRPGGVSGAAICSGGQSALIDFAATPENDAIPYEFKQDTLRSQLSVVRSFGTFFKYDLSFGLESRRLATTLPELEGHPPIVAEEFQRLLPTTDQRLGPFVQLRAHRNRFHRMMNVEALGLQEDYRVGHDVWMRLYPAAKAMGSSRDLLGMFNGASYSLPVLDGLTRAYVEHQVEVSTVEESDAQISGGLRIVSPRIAKVLRAVADLTGTHRYKNYLNPITSIGGTDRLRGYRLDAFVGPDVAVGNFELRTAPVHLYGVLVGAVAFWDAGDAFRGLDDLELKHAYGGGLRVLLPQLDRSVFRVDVGFPLDPTVPGAERTIIAQFRQAFAMPNITPPALVP